MEKNKVFIIDGDSDYEKLFTSNGWEITNSIVDADLVQFTGGADVSPSLYDEARHAHTWPDPNRDKREEVIYNQAQEMGIPCAGICRGGQFLNVMNGGRMYQHVNNHGRPHKAVVLGLTDPIIVSSTHHQMMRPNEHVDHIVLMTATEATRREWMGKFQSVHEITPFSKDDTEVVYYPGTNCLCFQPHPEFNADAYGDMKEIYFFFINNYLLPNVTTEEIKETSIDWDEVE